MYFNFFQPSSGKVCFVKVHAPWEVLCKWAEITRVRKPIAKNDLCDTVVDTFHVSRYNVFASSVTKL